jgi:2-polyprenyl-6-methoxyphenol hydroxylase-like FAD-dependent oxidoreductase
MRNNLDVAIVGYGSAGQAAAVLLARDGHRVEVFERAPEPGPVGAGLLLQPTGLQVLWKMGLLPQALAHGAVVGRLYGETPGGSAVMDMRYEELDARLFGLGMQRGALFALLDHARDPSVTLHCATAIGSVDHETGRLHDQRGARHGPFDLVIVADGSASSLRAQVATPAIDRPYPWGALWCLLPRDDWPWPDQLRQRYLRARRMVGLLPVGTRPGDATPRLSFFWSLPTADFDRWHSHGVPAWTQEVAALWPALGERLHGIRDCTQLLRASYRDTVLRRWYRGRSVLMGDAAHSMSPQLGQGVNMALMDALALREALREQRDVASALVQYQSLRSRHVALYHFWSRWLTPLFQSERDRLARLRDLAFLPLGRVPGGREHMLRVLSGTQQGHFGALTLEPEFLAALVPARAA